MARLHCRPLTARTLCRKLLRSTACRCRLADWRLSLERYTDHLHLPDAARIPCSLLRTALAPCLEREPASTGAAPPLADRLPDRPTQAADDGHGHGAVGLEQVTTLLQPAVRNITLSEEPPFPDLGRPVRLVPQTHGES